MNYNLYDWGVWKNRYGSAEIGNRVTTSRNKTEHDAKERDGAGLSAVHPDRNRLLLTNRRASGNHSPRQKFSSFSKLHRTLPIETSSFCHRSTIHSESSRNSCRKLGKKGNTSFASGFSTPINSSESEKGLNCETNDTILPVMGNVKNISVAENPKEIKSECYSEFCSAGRLANAGESELSVHNEDLHESFKRNSRNESYSSSLEEIPSISSKESSKCSKFNASSQDSAFVSSCPSESWMSPVVANNPSKNNCDANSPNTISNEESSLINSVKSKGQSNWTKVKLCVPSRKPQVTGVAVQQHPRSQQHTSCSKAKRRIQQKERERENAVVLDSKKLVLDDPKELSRLWIAFPFVYKINDGSSSGSGLLQQVCKERGWRECREKENIPQQSSCSSLILSQQGEEEGVGRVVGSQSWNLWWRTTTMTPERSSFLKSWQLTNHIPKISTNFSRKDNLARILSRMRSNHSTEYDFSPRSFILPQEYYRLLTVQRNRFSYIYTNTVCTPNSEVSSGTSLGYSQCTAREKSAIVWICKPVCKSQGKGIVVFDRVTEFSYDLPSVVQEYIKRPYLINGYKWDLRLYVCITSTSPLTIYAYRGGITRFATHKYDMTDLLNQYSHLTNTYINKQSSEYKKHKEGIGLGCKWTLKKLRSHFKKQNVQDYFLWQKIWSILVLTIIGDAKEITKCKNSGNCFEFLGFDILVDAFLKPHLLEVNTNPGLGCDEPSVDETVKKPMLHELFTLLGLPDGRFMNTLESCSNSEDLPYDSTTSSNHLDENKALEQLLYGNKQKISVSTSNSNSNQPTSGPSGSDSSVNASSCNYYQYNMYRQNCNVVFKAFSCQPDKCDASNVADLEMHENPLFSVSKNDLGQPELMPPVQLEIPIPTPHRNKSKMKLPLKNGPGMALRVRNWKKYSPKSCGDWVRVFPFNSVTREISGEQMHDDDVKEVVYQVNEFLKLVRTIQTDSPNKAYVFYNSCIQKFGYINTDIWYPHEETPVQMNE